MEIKKKHRRYQRFFLPEKVSTFFEKEKWYKKITLASYYLSSFLENTRKGTSLVNSRSQEANNRNSLYLYTCSPLHCHSSKPKFRFLYTFCVNCCLLFAKKVILFPPTRQYLYNLHELISMRQGKVKDPGRNPKMFKKPTIRSKHVTSGNYL